MTSWFRRNRAPDNIASLYGMIVAQARLPVFYREFGVADTVNGRFDLVVLHLALVFRRLTPPLGNSGQLAQALFDRFCQDMDDNLREIGIADLKVPKEMKRMGEAFYGRAAAYGEALSSATDGDLTRVLGRNIYDEEGRPAAAGLAAYVRAAAGALDKRTEAELAGGQFGFPDPAGFIDRAVENRT